MNTKNMKHPRSSFLLIRPIALFTLMMVLAGAAQAARVNWRALEPFQETITADTFSRLLNDLYAPDGSMIPYLRYDGDSVHVFSKPTQSNDPVFTLRFASVDPAPVIKRVGGGLPLSGLTIALDPGHIGGAWARMEERFFLVDRAKDWPVQEAAMNVFVARMMRDRLAELGADVHLVKNDLEPSSSVRPDRLMEKKTSLPAPASRFKHLPDIFVEASQRDAMRKQAEREFYRTEEIRARAEKVNEDIKPDVTLCIHFNATGYGDEKDLYEENGLAFFVNGSYMPGELRSDEQKQAMLRKLLERSHGEELGLTRAIQDAFVEATGLPPAYRVERTATMMRLGSDYIYARNLAANRLFNGPVIFLEPYFMNNRTVYARIQAGDYDGEREIDGGLYPSIFREYSDAVVDGVLRYYAPDYVEPESVEAVPPVADEGVESSIR